MSQPSENTHFDTQQVLAAFGCRAAQGPAAYGKALRLLEAFSFTLHDEGEEGAELFPLSLPTVASWLCYLQQRGLSASTALLYLDAVSALHPSASLPHPDSLTRAKQWLKANTAAWQKAMTLGQYAAALQALNHKGGAEQRLAASLLTLCLALGGADPAEAAALTLDSPLLDNPRLTPMRKAYAAPRRKYLLPLDQGNKTPAQLARQARAMVRTILPAPFSPAHMWAFAALRQGIGADIVQAIAPQGMPLPGLCPAAQLSDQQRQNAIDTVSRALLPAPPQWYAMRLRPHTDISRLRSALDALPATEPRPELFYPTRRRAVKTDGKLRFTTEPILPEIVFFRSDYDLIYPLFLQIGHLAWVYKDPSSGAYQPIPTAQFRLFQQTVATFTDDYDCGPIGSLPPRPGEEITLVGTPLNGMTVTPTAVKALPGRLYRLTFFGVNGIEWRLTAPLQ